EAKARGVDLVDCSSGGLAGPAVAGRVPREYGFQVPYAQAIRRNAEIATVADGLILQPHQAETILAQGSADFVAIGREALFNPNWPLHAELELLGRGETTTFYTWPEQYGWWLKRREHTLQRLSPLGEHDPTGSE